MFIPTAHDVQRVESLVMLGANDSTIAMCIGDEGIAVDTLRHHFRHELTRFREIRLGEIARGAYDMALNLDGKLPKGLEFKAKMFVLKTRAGWKESDQTIINAQNVQIVKRVIGVNENDL